MRKYSQISKETRQRIVYIPEHNLQSRHDVTKTFGLPYSTVCDIFRAYNRTGTIVLPQRGGKKPKKLSEMEIAQISQWLAEDCTLTLREIQRKIAIVFNTQVSLVILQTS
jgi:transposase